ncbi:MAG: DUF72 domain-containing protein [Oligoflexia bacterium]|nr:DUF72 domain-containing protein [Oligoflexia bacterium]
MTEYDSARELDRRRLEELAVKIKLGTSTWTYPGWKGIIYFDQYKNEKDFKARSLGEYATYPLFRTVGIDSSFYTPSSSKLLQSYAALVPDNFRWISKVWERLTVPRYPLHPRYGKYAGELNPEFLNPAVFIEKVLKPYQLEELSRHAGPFVFQFPTINRELLQNLKFLSKLDSFLAALPKHYRYATEIRNPELLSPDYFAILNQHGATHCFNHWNYMPPLKTQMHKAAEAGGLKADFYVARILTPLGVSYENAVKLFTPYDTIKRPNPEMRKDVARLISRALERDVEAYIIINNRAEGHAPGTIRAILDELATA